MVRVRFTGANHYHDGESLDQGDEVDVPERVYEQWSFKFELLEESSDSSENDSDDAGMETSDEEEESTSDETDTAESLEDVLDGNVGEVQDELESGEYDDSLDELQDLESDGDDRSTVHQAIEERREV